MLFPDPRLYNTCAVQNRITFGEEWYGEIVVGGADVVEVVRTRCRDSDDGTILV